MRYNERQLKEYLSDYKPKNDQFSFDVLYHVMTSTTDVVQAIHDLEVMCLENAEITKSYKTYIDEPKAGHLYKCPLCQCDYKESWYPEWVWDASVCDQMLSDLRAIQKVSDLDENMPQHEFKIQEKKIENQRSAVFRKYREHRIDANAHGFTKPWGLEAHYSTQKTPTNFCRPFAFFSDVMINNDHDRWLTHQNFKRKIK